VASVIVLCTIYGTYTLCVATEKAISRYSDFISPLKKHISIGNISGIFQLQQ